MKYSFAVGLSALLCLSFSLASAQVEKKDEKKEEKSILDIGGKTVDQWIKEIGSKDPSKREAAVRAIVAFGPEHAAKAAPALIAEVKRGTGFSPIDFGVRNTIASALGPILAENKHDPKVIKDGIVQLKRLMSDNQIVIRFRAAQSLARLGPQAMEALPEVISLSKEPTSWETRQTAAIALASLSMDLKTTPRPEVIMNLSRLLEDPAFQVRMSAVQAFVAMPAPADPTTKAVILGKLRNMTLKDPETNVKIWANMGIMGVEQGVRPDLVLAIAKYCKDEDAIVRTQAATALGSIGPKAQPALSTLIVMIGDEDPTTQAAGIWALGQLESAATSAVPQLEKIGADTREPEQLRMLAKAAVDNIKGKKKAPPAP